MVCDAVLLTAKNDSLIIVLGSRLFKKQGEEIHLHGNIRNKLRVVARFLLTSRKIYPTVKNLDDIIEPRNFHSAVEAVQILCKYDSATGEYKKPSLALKIGHSLKKCALIKKSESIIKGDENMRKSADDFIELCDFNWSTDISSHALKTLEKRKWNKPPILPLAEDLGKLQLYLKRKLIEFSEDVS